MNVHCFLFGHDSQIVGRDGRLWTYCPRCDSQSTGIALTSAPVPRFRGLLPNRWATRRADGRRWWPLRKLG